MKAIFTLVLMAFSFALLSAEFALMKNGKAVSSIVLSKNASLVEKHAADELAKFLAKISKGERPAIGTAPVKGKYPIYIGLTNDKRVKEEGIKISANKKGLYIEGNTPVGTLYGAYEVLKRFGGILWLEPGEEGEYFKVKPSITVPEGTIIHNPDFTYRDITGVCMSWRSITWDTWDWGVRNNMRFRVGSSLFNRSAAVREGLMKRAIYSRIGGHCFSPLLVYNPKLKTAKERNAYAKKMFKEHPDYFPLVRGKRFPSFHGGAVPQPCTSHPDVIRIIATNMAYQMKKSVQPVFIHFGNNDWTQWCECARCLAQDPPEEKRLGWKSTRYWLFANAVFKKCKELFPNARFAATSYQTFSRAPLGVQPYLGKDLVYTSLSNHRQCWKHPLNDKNCPTNPWFYEYNSEWHKMNIPLRTYEEFITAGRQFLPVEKNWVDKLKFYKKNMPNVVGMQTEICCPDGIYSGRFKTYWNHNNWNMMWQVMYLGMRFHWDINTDYDKEYEKIHSVYYGKGWNGGMREFRKLLTELYMNASGCHGYAHSTPRGKFLDVPGAKDKLYKYLDGAEKAAAKDPDPRALKHVKKVREYFEKTWITEYKKYISSFRTVTAYPLMGKITIDGKLDEKDWINADVTTRFMNSRTDKLAEAQTSVKIAYDADYIYMGLECIEPLREDQLVCLDNKHDGPVWSDNGVEIFINDPILGGAYYQFIINHKGVLADGVANPRFDKTYESGAIVKTRFGKGRYFVELKIPVSRITGGKLTAGTVLRMNVMRGRRPIKGVPGRESSTWSSGTPYSVETFHPVTFAAPRKVTAGNRTIIDTRPWKNGSFDELSKKPRIPKHWNTHGGKLVPYAWTLSDAKQYGGDMEYLLHPGSKTNRFVRLRKGYLTSLLRLVKKEEITAVFRARGKGDLQFRMLKKGRAGIIHTEKIDSENWKNYKFTFKGPQDLSVRHSLVLWPVVKGNEYIDVDDFYLR